MRLPSTIVGRWQRVRTLRAYRYFLWFYYGDRLWDYPLSAAGKLFLSRLLFLTHLPLLLPDRHSLVRCYDARMYVNLFASPIAMDRALGVYEYWMASLFQRIITEGMTVLDIGAHKGSYSVLFASLMRDNGKVIAFEPDPENCRWIAKNVAANGFQCIETCQLALSESEGSATFYAADGLGSLVANPSARGIDKKSITVQTRRLDDVLGDRGVQTVDVIKMDVEGADLMVLRGAEQTLRQHDASILMDVDVQTNAERRELYDMLRSLGYSIYRIGKELTPITCAEDMYLHDEQGLPVASRTRRVVRDIYATKRANPRTSA
jgi:FkbM family methyltransferase